MTRTDALYEGARLAFVNGCNFYVREMGENNWQVFEAKCGFYQSTELRITPQVALIGIGALDHNHAAGRADTVSAPERAAPEWSRRQVLADKAA